MATPIHPLADRIVAVREKAQSQTAAGLYIPDSAKEKPVAATIEAIGPDVKSLKIGEKVIFKEYQATEYKIGTDEYIIIKEEDVLGTMK